MPTPSLRARFLAAPTFAQFLESVSAQRELWHTLARRAVVDAALVERAVGLGRRRHLLVLLEAWCGDAVNTIPTIARLAELAPNLDLRVLARDENPDLMDAHRTGGTRSVPVVIVLDERFAECGWWGPRPAPLQAWVRSEGLTMPVPERYREIRRWYARDRGESTIRELTALLSCEAPCRAA